MICRLYTHTRFLWCLTGIALLSTACGVYLHEEAAAQKDAKEQQQPKAEVKTTKIGNNVFLEVEGDKRRVVIKGIVCRRTDMLEQFLCRKMTKEHEAIVSADVDAKHIHAALLVAGAEPGSPIKFDDKGNITPPRGTKIKVFVEYEEKGKTKKVPAQQWVKNIKTKKELEHDWVFAGSFLIPNRLDEKAPPFYAANDGDVICLANFDSALLDLPIASSKDNDDLAFEAWTERIPPLETPVTVILEPVLEKKKK
jgi:hypothetical protein